MSCVISSADLNESEISARLKRDGRSVAPRADSAPYNSPAGWAPSRAAAVLIPLIRMPVASGSAGWHILYTRRTDLVRHHKGQVSFPGGRRDPGDSSPVATALREACEEIGLQPSDVRILGRMEEVLTVSNYIVTPVVGAIPWPYPFILNPHEVSRVFTIPVDWLADATHYEFHRREFPPDFPIPRQFQNDRKAVRFLPYQGEVVWGATARVTLRLIKHLAVTPGS